MLSEPQRALPTKQTEPSAERSLAAHDPRKPFTRRKKGEDDSILSL